MTLDRCLLLGALAAALVYGSLQPSADVAPTPVDSPLAARFAASLAGAPAEERRAIGAMAGAMSRLLERDGRLAAPRIGSTHVMGQAWQELQRLYTGQESPYGDKYPEFEALLAEKFPAEETPLAGTQRRACCAVFDAIAEGLQ